VSKLNYPYPLRLMALCAIAALSYPGSTNATSNTEEKTAFVTSWYGPGMKCHKTSDGCVPLMANGQVFDMHDPTVAAHRDLPFGTRIELYNPDTNTRHVVIVQDRGPKVRKRDLDISLGAARILGLEDPGVLTLQARIMSD